jgi:hypothetical protein
MLIIDASSVNFFYSGFLKQTSPSDSLVMLRSDFKFCKVFTELFNLETWKIFTPCYQLSRKVSNLAIDNPFFKDIKIFLVGSMRA